MIDPTRITAARCALGRQLAASRKAAGLSQHQLAPRIHYGRSTIANVEVGRQNVPREFWEHCDRALGAGGRLLAASEHVDDLVRSQRQETAQLADAAAGGTCGPGRVADAASAMLHDDGALELADALGHSNVAPQALDLLQASVVRVAQTYSTLAPTSLLQWAQTRLAAVIAMLRGSQPIAQRRRLCVLAAQIAGLRGWLAHDLQQTVSAAALYGVATTAAEEAEDEALVAWVLGNHSRIPIYENEPRTALSLIEQALGHAEGHASATTRAWLWAQASRARTALGDPASGASALVEAERALDQAPADTCDEILYFDHGRLNAFIGHHYVLAGQPHRAEQHIRASLAVLRPRQVKHLSLTRLDLAGVLLAQNHLDEACGQAMTALDIPPDQVIDSTIRRASDLRWQLRPHARQLPAVREVIELIDRLSRA
jgi:tetratricopeptide (TPR) repeat protein